MIKLRRIHNKLSSLIDDVQNTSWQKTIKNSGFYHEFATMFKGPNLANVGYSIRSLIIDQIKAENVHKKIEKA